MLKSRTHVVVVVVITFCFFFQTIETFMCGRLHTFSKERRPYSLKFGSAKNHSTTHTKNIQRNPKKLRKKWN